MKVELLITDADTGKVQQPVIEEGIEWTTERRSTPGKLTFNVVKDDIIDFTHGSAVRLKVDGDKVFYGFVFKKDRNKDQIITVTAYDQLRYLQNKDTYVYENKTASQLIKMIAADFNLNVGSIENTSYIIASRVEENTSLFDMVENALDLELTNKKEMFVLYDNFGALTLKNISAMKVGDGENYLLLNNEAGKDFDYTSSIDSDTYNKVKLTYDNEDTGKREVYIAKDGTNINKWGVLQYFDTLQEGENGQTKADALLSLYNSRTRSLKITDVIGDNRVRAGSMVVVNLWLGDMTLKNFMLVEKCTHKYNLDEHLMDLTLRGGAFNA